MTNPSGVWVGYDYDSTGRMNRVNGAGYANVSTYAYGITYRAFGAVKGMSFGDHHDLSTTYDNRMRPTRWSVPGALDYKYAYDYYNEHTGRVTYAENQADGTLDRSYQYDQVGALVIAHSGAEARASAYSGQWGTMDGPYSHGYDYDKFGNLNHRYGWGGEVQGGTAGQSSDLYYTYSNNKNQRDGFTYDPAGNLTNDVDQTYSYDATGQQRSASSNAYLIQQGYDGDGLRGQKIENGVTTWYVRSSVLGGQVVAEMDGSGNWSRGYVYAGGELLAVQQSNSVNWVHEDAVTKSKRVTDIYGNIISTVELDPWGGDTNRSANSAFQPQQFTTYVRDANGGQDAMARRYATSSARFSQPDPYGGSYDFSDPQSLNRYAYAGNDPVNRRDPTGLMPTICGFIENANGDGGHWACVELWDSYHWGGYEPKDGGGGQPQDAGTRERLKGDRKDAYKTALDQAKRLSDECKAFLTSHGITTNSVLDALKKQKAYDGTTSTISLADAGLYVYGEPESTTQVKTYFADDPDIRGYTAVIGGERTRYDVYFGAQFDAIIVLHEALHSATMLDDFLLADKLGLKPQAHKDPSVQITEELKKHGCGG